MWIYLYIINEYTQNMIATFTVLQNKKINKRLLNCNVIVLFISQNGFLYKNIYNFAKLDFWPPKITLFLLSKNWRFIYVWVTPAVNLKNVVLRKMHLKWNLRLPTYLLLYGNNCNTFDAVSCYWTRTDCHIYICRMCVCLCAYWLISWVA